MHLAKGFAARKLDAATLLPYLYLSQIFPRQTVGKNAFGGYHNLYSTSLLELSFTWKSNINNILRVQTKHGLEKFQTQTSKVVTRYSAQAESVKIYNPFPMHVIGSDRLTPNRNATTIKLFN